MALRPIRLVTFDALYTLIVPRLPIHVQYSETFRPYFGHLDPESLRRSFKAAFAAVGAERPAYGKGSTVWWGEVIRRTALGAGADGKAVDDALPVVVPRLMQRFSSREGYRAFDDAIPTLHALTNLGIFTAVITNADARIRLAIHDLGFPPSLRPVVLSEDEGAQKPSPDIFLRAISRVNIHNKTLITPQECLHVGDELVPDYRGATNAGMNALMLRRPGPDGVQAHKEPHAQLEAVEVVHSLDAVIQWVKAHNGLP